MAKVRFLSEGLIGWPLALGEEQRSMKTETKFARTGSGDQCGKDGKDPIPTIGIKMTGLSFSSDNVGGGDGRHEV